MYWVSRTQMSGVCFAASSDPAVLRRLRGSICFKKEQRCYLIKSVAIQAKQLIVFCCEIEYLRTVTVAVIILVEINRPPMRSGHPSRLLTRHSCPGLSRYILMASAFDDFRFNSLKLILYEMKTDQRKIIRVSK